MDQLDRDLINTLQRSFPVSESPFAEVAEHLGSTEDEVIERVQRLREDGTLTRFGPLFHAGEMGGGLSLCALKVPEDRFDEVTEQVNAFPEVAHNYQREHELNMWFVLATETQEALENALIKIESVTGLEVFNFPKQEEFYVGLYFKV